MILNYEIIDSLLLNIVGLFILICFKEVIVFINMYIF